MEVNSFPQTQLTKKGFDNVGKKAFEKSARHSSFNSLRNSMLGDICFRLIYTKHEVAHSNIDIYHRKSTCLGPDGSLGQSATRFVNSEFGNREKFQPEVFSQSVPSHDSSAKNFQPRFPTKKFNFYGSGCGVVAEPRGGLGVPRW